MKTKKQYTFNQAIDLIDQLPVDLRNALRDMVNASYDCGNHRGEDHEGGPYAEYCTARYVFAKKLLKALGKQNAKTK